MKSHEQVLMIPKIELGIVIDHIPAGQGIKILKILSKAEEMKDIALSLGINYRSDKLDRKDLIKIQTEYLSPEIIQQISILVPGVTVKAIKEFKVHSKVVVQAPKEIRNLLECKNPNCITNTERHIDTFFTAVDENGKKVCCEYCEREFELKELKALKKN